MTKGKSIEQRIKQVLSSLVGELFPSGKLDDVHVEFGEDEDGDALVRIVLVFENQNDIDPAIASSFVRRLRPRIEEDLFPLVSFITSADDRKHQAAAR